MHKKMNLKPELITAISTALYVILTLGIIFESRKLRRSQELPQLNVFVRRSEKSRSILCLVIQNNGFGPAHDINLDSDKDFPLLDSSKYSFKEMGFIKNGIKFLPGNSEKECAIINLSTNNKEKIGINFTIKTKFKDRFGKKRSENFFIDLSEFENTILPQKPPIYDISENIEKILKIFSSIVQGNNKLKTQTKKENDSTEDAYLIEKLSKIKD